MKYKHKANIIILTMMIILVASAYSYEIDLSFNLEDELNVTLLNKSFDKAKQELMKLKYEGFNTTRYNDTLILANELYKNRIDKTNPEKEDFKIIKEKFQELEFIAEKSREASDEIKALKERIDKSSAADKKEINTLYNKAKDAFFSQRYEESLVWIEATYEKINDMEATETKMRALYEASKRNIVGFLKHNWRYVAGSFFGFLFIIMIFYPPYSKWKIRKKIKKLKKHELILKSFIAETQKDFFERKTLNEETYYTRINKYGKMIRDIYQQIPFLREELELKKDLKKDLAKKAINGLKRIKEKNLIRRLRIKQYLSRK